jgi:hypothetical protein
MKIASRFASLFALVALMAAATSTGTHEGRPTSAAPLSASAQALSWEASAADHAHRPAATASWEQVFASLDR